MKRVLGLVVLIVFVLVSGSISAFAEPPGKQLSAAEIKQKLIGNTTRQLNKKGNWIFVYLKENGSAHGKAELSSASGNVTGDWKITDDGTLCVNWNSAKWESGCRSLYLDEKSGEIGKYSSGGSLSGKIIEIMPGNPQNLR